MQVKGSPRAIAAVTVAVVAAIVLIGLVFANPEQCPVGATQAEVDATGCSVGANIGLGLLFMLAVVAAIVGAILTATTYFENRRGR